MKNLYEIQKFSDSEFLSFLYSEHNRYKDKESKNGWTVWALVGSLFTILCFVYAAAKSCNADINLELFYCIISVFLPIFQYLIFLFERKKALENGDSRHIAKIKDIAPVYFLCYLGIIDIGGCISGYYLGYRELAFRYLIAFIPITLSIGVYVAQKTKYATTSDLFIVSSKKWINNLLCGFIAGTITVPVIKAMQYLAFGLSIEFELGIACILFIALLYLLVKIVFSKSIESDICELIDGYLYGDKSKQDTIKSLEKIILGNRPTDELESVYNRLCIYEKKLPEWHKEFDEIIALLNENCEEIESVHNLHTDILKGIDEIKEFLELKTEILEKSKELLDLKSLSADPDFMAMLDMLLDNATFKNASELQKKMEYAMEMMHKKCYETICINVDCPYRCDIKVQ